MNEAFKKFKKIQEMFLRSKQLPHNRFSVEFPYDWNIKEEHSHLIQRISGLNIKQIATDFQGELVSFYIAMTSENPSMFSKISKASEAANRRMKDNEHDQYAGDCIKVHQLNRGGTPIFTYEIYIDEFILEMPPLDITEDSSGYALLEVEPKLIKIVDYKN